MGSDALSRWREMREEADRGRVVGSSIPCKLGDELAAELETYHERYVTESLDVVKRLQARVAELETTPAVLDDDDQLQCASPLWSEAEEDTYPCDQCSCCKARVALKTKAIP